MAEPGKLTLTASLLALVGAGLLVVGLLSLKDARDAQAWPSVEGRIVSSRVVTEQVEHTHAASGRTRIRTKHRAEIVYDYSVGGQQHRGERIYRLDPGSQMLEETEKLVELYPAGASVAVHLDPDDPSSAVLVNSVGAQAYAPPLLGAIALVMALGMWLAARRS